MDQVVGSVPSPTDMLKKDALQNFATAQWSVPEGDLGGGLDERLGGDHNHRDSAYTIL